ncbi:hypothetical protein D9M70_554070 [compost metagenome]
MSIEAQRHDPRERRVDEAQPYALTRPESLSVRNPAVERHRVADATGHPRFHPVAESGGDAAVLDQPPVGKHPDKVAVDGDGFAFLHDHRSGEAAAELLEAVGVRVIPEGSGIRRRELVDEALSRPDRRPRQPRHAVHGVGKPDAMPVDRRFLREAVFDDETRGVALAKAY